MPGSQCQNCTPEQPGCTLESFVDALNKGDPSSFGLTNCVQVEDKDGRLRKPTLGEEIELGIRHLPQSKGPLEGIFPLYGKPSHCRLQLVITKV